MNPIATPVLFLIFNRPIYTKKVFNVIRSQRPLKLYIAADGPRLEHPEDEVLCEQARRIALEIDWDCKVEILFRDENSGCKEAISSAITWFFDQESEGIILEDDCLPDPTFFRFCEELLEKYRDDSAVFSISGSNLLGRPWKSELQSYFFAHGGIWGWATWKRAWRLYDQQMKEWEREEIRAIVKRNMHSKAWYRFYFSMFESSFNGSLNTWDIQWFYTILINNGFTINPAVDLVENIGFGMGTHFQAGDTPLFAKSSAKMIFPLKHPSKKEVDVEYLRLLFPAMNGQIESGIGFKKMARIIRSLLGGVIRANR